VKNQEQQKHALNKQNDLQKSIKEMRKKYRKRRQKAVGECLIQINESSKSKYIYIYIKKNKKYKKEVDEYLYSFLGARFFVSFKF